MSTISCPSPIPSKQGMSKDQRYLYYSCKAIIDGKCPAWLAKRKIGGVSHARWLTTAIRINFVYMATPVPTTAIKRLATFVVQGYACWWFQSRVSWRITDAPKLVFTAMKYVHSLCSLEKEALKLVIERNFYWGHPESVLIACLASPDEDIRSHAVARILKAKEAEAAGEVRIFNLPAPVYTASRFDSMIDWNKVRITSPPLLRKLSADELRLYEKVPMVSDLPHNTQHLERLIQLMAANATRAADPKLRDGFCKATIRNRASRPKMESKSDFS